HASPLPPGEGQGEGATSPASATELASLAAEAPPELQVPLLEHAAANAIAAGSFDDALRFCSGPKPSAYLTWSRAFALSQLGRIPEIPEALADGDLSSPSTQALLLTA